MSTLFFGSLLDGWINHLACLMKSQADCALRFFCSSAYCTNGMFVPPICEARHRRCATLIAGFLGKLNIIFLSRCFLWVCECVCFLSLCVFVCLCACFTHLWGSPQEMCYAHCWISCYEYCSPITKYSLGPIEISFQSPHLKSTLVRSSPKVANLRDLLWPILKLKYDFKVLDQFWILSEKIDFQNRYRMWN